MGKKGLKMAVVLLESMSGSGHKFAQLKQRTAQRRELVRFDPFVSPGRSPMKGNLTGVARKVRDSCVDWHNYVEKWKVLSTTGADCVNNIANSKLQSIMSEQIDENAKQKGYLPEEIFAMTDKLNSVCKEMIQIVDKFKNITTTLQKVADLEWYQGNESFCEEPLFQTWTTDMFVKKSTELVEKYEKETQLRQAIAQNVAHADTRDLIMMYSACWVHQPYLDSDTELILQSLLKETGLT